MGKDGCRPVLWPPLGVARALMFPEQWLMSAGAGVYSIRVKLGSCPERPTLYPKSSAMAKARILPASTLGGDSTQPVPKNPQMIDFFN